VKLAGPKSANVNAFFWVEPNEHWRRSVDSREPLREQCQDRSDQHSA
jgi:hypothetical protein